MTLTRAKDGSWRTEYRGIPITVRRANPVHDKHGRGAWVAEAREIKHRDTTRAGALSFLQHMLDMEMFASPELDALIERWLREVDDLSSRLPDSREIFRQFMRLRNSDRVLRDASRTFRGDGRGDHRRIAGECPAAHD